MGGVSDAQAIDMALDWLAKNWVVVSLLCGACLFMGNEGNTGSAALAIDQFPDRLDTFLRGAVSVVR